MPKRIHLLVGKDQQKERGGGVVVEQEEVQGRVHSRASMSISLVASSFLLVVLMLIKEGRHLNGFIMTEITTANPQALPIFASATDTTGNATSANHNKKRTDEQVEEKVPNEAINTADSAVGSKSSSATTPRPSRQALCQQINHFEFVDFCQAQIFGAADAILSNQQQILHVVQIGAHVGFEENDPLAQSLSLYLNQLSLEEKQRFHWTFVEPSPPNYQKLAQNLDQHASLCTMDSVQAAVIADNTTSTSTNDNDAYNHKLTFYTISESVDPITGRDSKSGKILPSWITQLSSLSKEPILYNRQFFEYRGLAVEDYIVETQVDALSYSALMKRIMSAGTTDSNNTKRPPFLVLIDTEGWDCDIILGIAESSNYWPPYMMFETNQCGDGKLQQTFAYLRKMGYNVRDLQRPSQNAIAIRHPQEQTTSN